MNELKGNDIEWSLTVLQKEKLFMDAEKEMKMMILEKIANNKEKIAISTIIKDVDTIMTTRNALLQELTILNEQSTLSNEEKAKVFKFAKNQILEDKFVDSFNNKKFKCSEWIIIRNQFGYMVSVDFFLTSINFIQTDSTGVTASENERDFPSTTSAKFSTFDSIKINDERKSKKKIYQITWYF